MNDRSSASSASGRVGTASRLSATNYRIGTARNIGIPQKVEIIFLFLNKFQICHI